MERDAAYWYRKYEDYQTQLDGSNNPSKGGGKGRELRLRRCRRLSFEQFRAMWDRILLDPVLAERWIHRLSVSYAEQKASVLAMLDETLRLVSPAELSRDVVRRKTTAA